MYEPPHFRETRLPMLQAAMRDQPLATLVMPTGARPEVNHIPLLLDATGEFGTLRGHVARASPVWQNVAEDAEVLAIFHGVGHYISPGWYAAKRAHGRVVPTWNYCIVHAWGRVRWVHDPSALRALVSSLTDLHERSQSAPWSINDAPADYIDRMLGAIVGFEIVIGELTGKWKLGQNRDAADRAGVHAALSASSEAHAQEMARAMEAGTDPLRAPEPGLR